MQILETNEYKYVTEYTVKTKYGIFHHTVSNEVSTFEAKAQLKALADKMARWKM